MTRFFKLSGSGNDFLALAETGETAEDSEAPAPERIRAWCRRGVSLGADGLFVLRRAPEGVAMEYWNADGRPADLCLNGTRCAAQLAFRLGWAEGKVQVATPAGGFSARRLDDGRIALDLPAPAEPPRPLELEVEVEGRTIAGWAITVGVPHFVLLWPASLERAPIILLGRPLRSHPAFGAAGTNVDFVRFPRPGRMEIRTYERGVEDETLSCGTGVLAGAAVGLALGLAALPLTVLTQGGFELEVSGESGRWSLAGDARVVAEGDLLAAAELGPRPPDWT